MKESILGQKQKEVDVEEKAVAASRTRALADVTRERKKFTTENGSAYEYAQQFDAEVNKEYIPAKTWEQLEKLGSVQWVKERMDRGEQYEG